MTRIEKQLAVAKLHYDNIVHTAKTGQRWLDAEMPKILQILKQYDLKEVDYTSNSWVEQGVFNDSEYFFVARLIFDASALTDLRRKNLQRRLQSASSFSVSLVMYDGITIRRRIR